MKRFAVAIMLVQDNSTGRQFAQRLTIIKAKSAEEAKGFALDTVWVDDLENFQLFMNPVVLEIKD